MTNKNSKNLCQNGINCPLFPSLPPEDINTSTVNNSPFCGNLSITTPEKKTGKPYFLVILN